METTEELRAVIHINLGGKSHKSFKLPNGGIILGREKGDLLLKDESISSSHCQIQHSEGSYKIYDMNSTNGTYVNGKKVIKEALNNGDKIVIGKTEILFSLKKENDVRDIPLLSKANKSTDGRTQLIESYFEHHPQAIHALGLSFKITYGNGLKEEIILQRQSVFIGRACDFGNFENDESLAPRHVEVKVNIHGFTFVENQSLHHKSFINNEEVTGVQLIGSEDELKIGSCRIKISVINHKSLTKNK